MNILYLDVQSLKEHFIASVYWSQLNISILDRNIGFQFSIFSYFYSIVYRPFKSRLAIGDYWDNGHQSKNFDGTYIVIALNTLMRRQNGRHFADDIFKRIFFNENIWIPIKISLNFVPKGSITNIPALVQIMAWRGPGDKPLSESMMVNLPTHIYVTRPQWVKKVLDIIFPRRITTGTLYL